MPESVTTADLARERKALAFDDRDAYLLPYQDAICAVYEQGGSLVLPNLKTSPTRRPGAAEWVSQYFYALPAESGAVDRVVILTEDITERMQAEEQIRRMNADLENRVEERTRELLDAQKQLVKQEKLAVLGKLAGGVGHELLNPLGVISNAVYFLKMAQPEASGKVQEYLDLIENHVRVSDKIVNDLLDFTWTKPAERAAVSIPDALRQALERFPAPENVRVMLDLPADLPRVYADPLHVPKILGNLILNACQAMRDGGRLSILARVEAQNADPQMPITNYELRITVQDTGMGIPPENMDKLFEPLFTTKVKGIGLGLAVCRKLLEANGGRVAATSEMGVGSVFSVYLPVDKVTT
jgi:signal transduction histidine kinase